MDYESKDLEWVVVDANGDVEAFDSLATAQDRAARWDESFPSDAPHRVMRLVPHTESKSVPEDDKKSVLDKAVEYEDDRGFALPHHDDACRLLCSIGDKPHRAIKYISELIESHREDAARTTEHKSMGQTWAPSQERVAAYRAATTRLDRVAALNHSLQDFIEDTDPPNRRALISLLTDYICAVEGIGDRATEHQSVDREDRDGTKTFKAECEGDTVQVTVRSGGAMLTVYDDELGSTAHVLVEPVIATLSAAGLVEPSATKYKSIAYLPEDEQAGERVDEYLRESLPDDDAQPITRDTECSFMSLTPEQADTIATAMGLPSEMSEAEYELWERLRWHAASPDCGSEGGVDEK